MAVRPFNILSLCSGIGGLDLGLSLAIHHSRVICFVEREAYAAATLVARMEDETLDRASVWDDLATFDGRAWRGLVDCVSAGFPCQPWSQAGQRKGTDDPRWLWPYIARIVREVRPRFVFLENVTGLLMDGLGYVLGDLAEGGFDAEWDVFSAAQIGAPHFRERVFVLAHTARDGVGAISSSRRKRRNRTDSGGTDTGMADAGQGGCCEGHGHLQARQSNLEGCGSQLASANCERRDEGRPAEQGQQRLFEAERPSGSAFPPGPADTDRWLAYLEAHPRLEPAVCRGADGIAYRLDRLAACGNGVVPVVAAYAFRTLMALFEISANSL